VSKKVPPIEDWEDKFTSEQTIQMIRDYFGMPKLENKSVICKSCGKKMTSQYKSGVRQEHFCSYCHYQQGLKIQEFF